MDNALFIPNYTKLISPVKINIKQNIPFVDQKLRKDVVEDHCPLVFSTQIFGFRLSRLRCNKISMYKSLRNVMLGQLYNILGELAQHPSQIYYDRVGDTLSWPPIKTSTDHGYYNVSQRNPTS